METLCDEQIVIHILLFTYQTIQKAIYHKQLILTNLMIQYVLNLSLKLMSVILNTTILSKKCALVKSVIFCVHVREGEISEEMHCLRDFSDKYNQIPSRKE